MAAGSTYYPRLNVVVGQFQPKKGDYAFNLKRVGAIFEQLGHEAGPVDLLTFPETAMCGYFLEGGVREVAVRKEQLFDDLQTEYLARRGSNALPLDITIGYYEEANGILYNSALYATLGTGEGEARPRLVHNHRKFFLPTYGVFDEERFVTRGRRIQAFDTRFGRFGMLICEDVWHSITGTILALQGAQLILVGNASPARSFEGQEPSNATRWRELVKNMADEHNLHVVLTNLVGFEGGRGFIGGSVVANPFGEIALNGPIGRECLLQTQLNLEDLIVARSENPLVGDLENTLPDLIAELNSIPRD